MTKKNRPIRVAQIGTGNVGGHALKALITNPDYELTGVWVSSEAKAGKDAAELVGLDTRTGQGQHRSRRGAGHQAGLRGLHSDGRQPVARALEDYAASGRRRQRRRQRPGVPAVPWQVIPDEMITPLEDAAREGKSSSTSTASTRASPTTCSRWP